MKHTTWAPLFICVMMLAAAWVAAEPTDGFTFEQGLDVQLDGKTWLRTVTTPFDKNNPELTYKVYTHLYDFAGAFPITKGAGGKYSHHRGLFIGWNHTHVGGRVVDTWHMRAGRGGPAKEIYAHQQVAEWLSFESDGNRASHTARILWATEDLPPFIEEERTIIAYPGEDGMRMVDFISELKTLAGPIRLRGDAHHAGMQIRMSNEVAENEEETEFILPDGAAFIENDNVEGAWWLCGSMPVGGTRYWVMHLTEPDLATGQPIYSTRRYGRFGAFFEPDLTPDAPLRVAFRIILSAQPLDQARCEALHQKYKQETARNQ
ncbi:MAG TPA: hypothetical protein ENN29_08665 [Candidatus Hydrogenedentes bacterium]|nr:hypothetical protein [Candidatus Hydrogenedentota bacterium]